MPELWKVKPLVWTLFSCPTPFEYCETLFGTLVVGESDDAFTWQIDGEFWENEKSLYGSEEDARDAAEAWYRERIEQALEKVEG